mmetsp:Transcript_5305/g.7933  ORF Transcript_5305/g.7933 Transcript_5305/m.7933 type:complete len:163 (-) Transcript_5305:107-595(-)
MPVTAAIKASLVSEECLLMIHDHLTSLSQIFCQYAELEFSADGDNDVNVVEEFIREQGIMTVKQFGMFASDCKFLGRNVSMKDVRQVFSASQHDETMNEAEANVDSHQEIMVFAEFIEAIARLGVLKYSSEGESASGNDDEVLHIGAIRKAFDRVVTTTSKR